MPRWRGKSWKPRHECEHCEHSAALPMKPINPFPLIAMLVIVGFLVLWLNGYLA